MLKKSIKNLFGYILSLVMIVGLVTYILTHKSDFQKLLEIPWYIILVLIFLQFITVFSNSMFLEIIMNGLNQGRLELKDSVYITIISTIGNYFLPMRGGAGIRAVYLKKKLKVSYTDFFISLYGNYIIVFLVFSTLGLLSLVISKQYSNSILLLFFLGIDLASIFLILVKTSVIKRIKTRFKIINRLIGTFAKLSEGWDVISTNYSLMIKLLGLTLLNFIILVVITILEFKALNLEFTLSGIVLYSAISGLSILFSITPGSIGIKEGMLIAFNEAIKINSLQVLQIAVVDRSSFFITLLILQILMLIYNGVSKRRSTSQSQ